MIGQLDSAKARDAALVRTAWGIFLIGAGGIWFTEQMVAGLNVEGAIPLLAGAVLLGLNAIRATTGIKVRYFTAGLGVILAMLGLADMAEAYLGIADIPIVPVALIVVGILLLAGSLRGRRDEQA